MLLAPNRLRRVCCSHQWDCARYVAWTKEIAPGILLAPDCAKHISRTNQIASGLTLAPIRLCWVCCSHQSDCIGYVSCTRKIRHWTYVAGTNQVTIVLSASTAILNTVSFNWKLHDLLLSSRQVFPMPGTYSLVSIFIGVTFYMTSSV